ncbi:MAG: DUF4139 domain-containing protein [Myxococcaceae bacterium]|nr:DUF4139 domain-containing protein [Myxococcaceae bacterium]
MKPIDTRVETVTLYHRGATVRRTASLDFAQGLPSELVIAGLPLSLLDHTVRARVDGKGGAVVLSNVRIGLWAPPRGTPEKPPDQKELEATRAKLELTRDRIAQLEHELAQLGGVAVNPRPSPEEGKPPTPSPMFARASLEAIIEDSSAKRVDQLRTLRAEEKKLVEAQAALERRIALASTATAVRPDELSKSVTVQVLQGSTAKSGTLVLEYFVLGARWAPAYQCRMARDCRSADLQLRAMVCQRTGEDWRGVNLKLSTASPMSWTELPELSSIRIGRAQPPAPPKRGFRPPPQGASSLFTDYDRGLSQARASRPVIPTWQPPELELAPLPSLPAPELATSRGFAPSADMARDLDDEAYAEEEESVELERAPAKELKKMAARREAPPPPAMAAPAPAMAGPPGMAMRSAVGAAGLRAKAADARGGERQSAHGGDEEGALLSASVDVVLYASLRLSAASDGTRGHLTPVDRRRAFLDALASLQLSASFDVLSVVEAAERQGHDVYSLSAPANTSDVRSEAGWYDYVYPTDATVDVPSDGTWHSVPVNTRTATGDVRYVVVPREDPQVYRVAMVKNPLPSPLLPGPVEVYVAGEYVLTTTLPSVPPGGDFKLSLGVEQAVKVARNTTFSEQRSGDKVVATTELLHDIVIDIANNLDREATFEVRERIPQPAPEAEVVVDEGKVTPTWEAYKQEERQHVVEGGRRWVVQVKPGATQTLKAHYRVKLYANNELVGGNRREA